MRRYLLPVFMVMFLSSSLYASMVLDDANILSKDKRLMKMYKLYNKKLLEDFDIDFRVATTNTKDNIDIWASLKTLTFSAL